MNHALAIEPDMEAATPDQERHTKPLMDWLEEQQERAEIRHLRASIRTNERLGLGKPY